MKPPQFSIMPKKEEIWNRILKSLEIKFSKSDLDTWLSKARLRSLAPDRAVIEVPNKFFARWLKERYAPHIESAFQAILSFVPEIRFACGPAAPAPADVGLPGRGAPARSAENQLTFDDFVTGDSNRFACVSALEVSRKPAQHYNPLFIFGKSGLGKTHLLHAIEDDVRRRRPSMHVAHLSTEQFTQEFLYALRKQRLPELRRRLTETDFFLLDDVHLLSGRRKVQAELTSLFNLLLGSNKQIVVTAKGPPKEIQDLDDQLRSRLEWGLLAELALPDQKVKIRIIQQVARREKATMPDDVAFYLANTAGDPGSLNRNVVRLVAHASLYGQKLDISTAKSVIKSGSAGESGIEKIQKLTAGYFNVAVADLLSDKRTRKVSYPRQLAMFLCRDFTSLSLKEIGEAFGRKDHSSVIYAVKRIDKDKDRNREILNDLNRLRDLLA